MQRYTQANTMLLTADERSLAFAGLMLPDTLIAALKGQPGQGLELPMPTSSAWSLRSSGTIGSSQASRTSSTKGEMRGGALGGRPLRSL